MATNQGGVIDKAAYFEKIGYKPHRKQWLYHQSMARFRVACCGRRFGKSSMAARDIQPELHVPDRRYWIVGPTYDLGEKEFRYIWRDMIVKLKYGRDKRVKKAYSKRSGEMYMEFPWGTRLEVRSAQHPDTLVGDGLHGVIMSEAAKHKRETWEQYIRAALADYRGWATFVTTPEGYNWLYDLWMLGHRAKQGEDTFKDFESWSFPSWDNPYVYPDGRTDSEIKLIEATTAKEWFMQEYGAQFGSFLGKIYDEFDPTMHIKKHRFRPDWPNYIAFDWGFTNPLAAIEFQVDPWDRVYVWREHYLPYKQLGEHIRIIKQRDQPEGYHLDLAYGDAADPAAALYVSQQLVGCWALPEAKENWRQGIDLVKTFLMPRDVILPDGSTMYEDEYGTPAQEPWLTIDPSCINTIREFNNYRAVDSRPEINPREAAKRFDDHALDALRYGLMHRFQLGLHSHLADVLVDSSAIGSPSFFSDFRGIESLSTYRGTDDDFSSGFFSQNMDF